MPVAFDFDFKHPDYGKVFRKRIEMLEALDDINVLQALKLYYKTHPIQFINDWGCTFDPRNADIDLPTTMPFILYDKQEEACQFILDRWRGREPGIIEKSREVGVTWLAVSLACTLCLFREGMVIGFGSRKENYVDKIGDPKSIFWKARKFMEYLPHQFTGSWNIKRDAPYMRIIFPDTGSAMTGEAGDNIGRGDRTSIYFVDESAHIMRPQLVEASLSATTNCRIDISSANGMGNAFAQKRFRGTIKVFTFHWRDDPRKDEAWYEKQKNELDPVTLAQEVDMNYSASLEGIVIPADWVSAAVDACKKLGIEPTGRITAALDVADEGRDLNAIGARKGIELIGMRSWSGKDSDTNYTSEKAFLFCDETEAESMQYDADGLGAFVRADARLINERRTKQNERQILIFPFRGSGEVLQPDSEMIKGRKNKDYFANRKAQAWWALRLRFQTTFRAVKAGKIERQDIDNIISIPSDLKDYTKLIMELSQPTYTITTAGKILVDKAPEGARSPNLADMAMMLYSPAKRSTGLFSAVPNR